MGTRSLTRIIDTSWDKEDPLTCIYRQFDGYPSGHGAELSNFLDGMHIVNGLGLTDNRKLANGAGCFAAQLIAYLKQEPGGVYIYPPNATDRGEEYVYTLKVGHGLPIGIEVRDPKNLIFEGGAAKFAAFCAKR